MPPEAITGLTLGSSPVILRIRFPSRRNTSPDGESAIPVAPMRADCSGPPSPAYPAEPRPRARLPAASITETPPFACQTLPAASTARPNEFKLPRYRRVKLPSSLTRNTESFGSPRYVPVKYTFPDGSTPIARNDVGPNPGGGTPGVDGPFTIPSM